MYIYTNVFPSNSRCWSRCGWNWKEIRKAGCWTGRYGAMMVVWSAGGSGVGGWGWSGWWCSAWGRWREEAVCFSYKGLLVGCLSANMVLSIRIANIADPRTWILNSRTMRMRKGAFLCIESKDFNDDRTEWSQGGRGDGREADVVLDKENLKRFSTRCSR